VVKIGGDNSSWEFSGWQKGIDFVLDENFTCDVILFANDAFYAYGWSIFEKAAEYNLPYLAHISGSALGQLDTKGYAMTALGYDVTSWLCTNSFFLPTKIVKAIETLVSVDDLILSNILPDNYEKGRCFF